MMCPVLRSTADRDQELVRREARWGKSKNSALPQQPANSTHTALRLVHNVVTPPPRPEALDSLSPPIHAIPANKSRKKSL